MNALWLATALVSAAAIAQTARPPEGERAPRPESASNARVGGWCDALTGEKKEQCLRDERRRKEQRPENEREQRVPIEVGAKSNAGHGTGRAD
jgi:hypothetical protein